MKVLKEKVKKRVWKFRVNNRVVATTRKKIGYKTRLYGNIRASKKSVFYTLTWNVKGLLRVVRKRGMKGVIISSEYYPTDFTNYFQSDHPFSPKRIEKTIKKGIRLHFEREALYERQRIRY